jgi:hypothetical protein
LTLRLKRAPLTIGEAAMTREEQHLAEAEPHIARPRFGSLDS